jgi:hypothetical protein
MTRRLVRFRRELSSHYRLVGFERLIRSTFCLRITV